MRAAVKQNTNEVVIKEVPIPVPGDGEVLVKINTVGVCASDLHLVREAFAYLRMAPGVDIVGHEGCGTVAARKPDFHLAVQAQYNGWVIGMLTRSRNELPGHRSWRQSCRQVALLRLPEVRAVQNRIREPLQ